MWTRARPWGIEHPCRPHPTRPDPGGTVSSSDYIAPTNSATGSQVHITRHARQRYLERVDAEEPYPAAAIREAWHAVCDGENGGDEQTAVVLVYTVDSGGAAILTVYPNDECDGLEVRRA